MKKLSKLEIELLKFELENSEHSSIQDLIETSKNQDLASIFGESEIQNKVIENGNSNKNPKLMKSYKTYKTGTSLFHPKDFPFSKTQSLVHPDNEENKISISNFQPLNLNESPTRAKEGFFNHQENNRI